MDSSAEGMIRQEDMPSGAGQPRPKSAMGAEGFGWFVAGVALILIGAASWIGWQTTRLSLPTLSSSAANRPKMASGRERCHFPRSRRHRCGVSHRWLHGEKSGSMMSLGSSLIGRFV